MMFGLTVLIFWDLISIRSNTYFHIWKCICTCEVHKLTFVVKFWWFQSPICWWWFLIFDQPYGHLPFSLALSHFQFTLIVTSTKTNYKPWTAAATTLNCYFVYLVMQSSTVLILFSYSFFVSLPRYSFEYFLFRSQMLQMKILCLFWRHLKTIVLRFLVIWDL
jgi:hypothetical protein